MAVPQATGDGYSLLVSQAYLICCGAIWRDNFIQYFDTVSQLVSW